MSSIMKVFLLLAVIVCISKAQRNDSGQCLCQHVRNRISSPVKDIQIYPATIFCGKVEIVVTLNSGLRFCLNPKMAAVQRVMASIMKSKTSTTVRSTMPASTPGSTNTAHL
ncbi:C-X-C motif chemokine 10-like [Cottoperca gobio]|uniref:C-X-C motif chemokine 10-like n=1 Tax=Cottoperca gobio TaxID=56716 RepID=A0A6J2QJZ2_COTGO|nr:C-X-C motif chemokine 10-like [Cottoperca gobio]